MHRGTPEAIRAPLSTWEMRRARASSHWLRPTALVHLGRAGAYRAGRLNVTVISATHTKGLPFRAPGDHFHLRNAATALESNPGSNPRST